MLVIQYKVQNTESGTINISVHINNKN